MKGCDGKEEIQITDDFKQTLGWCELGARTEKPPSEPITRHLTFVRVVRGRVAIYLGRMGHTVTMLLAQISSLLVFIA
jgi:hypothetical protein